MAVPEDEEGDPDPDSASLPGVGASGGDTGPRNGRHPIPASDNFAAELPENMDIINLNVQTVVASIGERVTSACGTSGLDITTRATVLRQQSSSTLVPQRDERVGINTVEAVSSNNIVSSSEAAIAETNTQSSTVLNDTYAPASVSLSSAPLLSLITLDESLSRSVLASPGVSLQESELVLEAPQSNSLGEGAVGAEGWEQMEAIRTNRLTDDSKQPVSHFGEQSITSQVQKDTSGYSSADACSKSQFEKSHPREATLSTRTGVVNETCLRLSETGIHAIQCESGTHRYPFYPHYSGLINRLRSFPEAFLLGDSVSVNRDLLALAGFFYSENGTVTCFHCGCSPRVWGDGRYPKTEHRMLSPYCRALPVLRD